MKLFEPLWANHYAQKLTAHELNQFRQAEARGSSRLLTDVIQIESYDQGAGRYMAVNDHTAVEGRSHFRRVELKYGRAAWEHQCFFTNTLRIASPRSADFNHPSERVLVGPHHILTFEFDTKSLAFFQQQLSWFRSPRKPLDSPIGKLVRHLRREYADVVGLNVTYSGNKSFHYHFVVETSQITGSVQKPTSARLGFQKAWDRLHDEFVTVMIQGSNPIGLINDEQAGGTLMPRLPRPLGEMMDLWATEYQQRHLGPGGRMRTPMEQEFAEAATDKSAAFEALGTVINGLISTQIARPEVHLLAAPEGIRKTRTLIANVPRYHRLLKGNGLPSWIMLASPTYDGAAEKAEEFAEAHQGAGSAECTPVFLESFSEIYRQEFSGRKENMINHTEAARLGFSSRFDAVAKVEPKTMDRIRRRYADLRASFSQTSPIFFSVHPVAQSWGSGADSRLLLSPAMWDTSLDKTLRRQRAMDETRLGLLIHDEIDAEGIVEAEPARRVAVVLTMVKASGWTSKTTKADKFRDHEQFMGQRRHADFVPFEEACRIADVAEADWDVCLSRPCGEYGPRTNGGENIYDQAEDRHWCLRARNWANLSAHKALILTTEAVPVALAERADLWNITVLDTPLIQKDRVEAHPLRALKSSTTADHVAERRVEAEAAGSALHAIGNKLGALENAQSHIAAKGSNGLIGKDIVQTMTLMRRHLGNRDIAAR